MYAYFIEWSWSPAGRPRSGPRMQSLKQLTSLVLLLLCCAAAAHDVADVVNGVTPDDATVPSPAATSTTQQAGIMHSRPRPSPSPAPRNPLPRLPPPPSKAERAARNLNKTVDTVMFVQTASYATVTRDTMTLYDVDKTQWFLNRPERETGAVETHWVLSMLHMYQRERAVNADITYVSGYGQRPRSATVMLWNPDYDIAKRRLTYNWAPLGDAANSAPLLPTNPKGGSRSTLQSVSLFIDSCPSNVPFICCQGESCTWIDEDLCYDSSGPTNAQLSYYKNDYQQFSCPQNYVGTVISNACWDSHTKVESYSGSCVACHSTSVDQLCESAFPTQCANGACTNSWYPGYWPYFCNINPTNTPNTEAGSCQCGGVDSPPSSNLKSYCNYNCPTSWYWCSTL